MTTVIEWCSFCSARPSDGTLKVLDQDTGKTVEFKICQTCYIKVPKDRDFELQELISHVV